MQKLKEKKFKIANPENLIFTRNKKGDVWIVMLPTKNWCNDFYKIEGKTPKEAEKKRNFRVFQKTQTIFNLLSLCSFNHDFILNSHLACHLV